MEKQAPVQELKAHRGIVTCLQFAQGTLVTGSMDKTVKLWCILQDEADTEPIRTYIGSLSSSLLVFVFHYSTSPATCLHLSPHIQSIWFLLHEFMPFRGVDSVDINGLVNRSYGWHSSTSMGRKSDCICQSRLYM